MNTQQQRPIWRRELSDLVQRLGALVDSLDSAHSTFPGVVHEQHTRCGKPNCVCVREGRLHAAWCVSYLLANRRRHRTIPARTLAKIQTLAERYRVLRQQRAEINRLFCRLLEVFDRLERSLRVPASRVLPERRTRKRSRKEAD